MKLENKHKLLIHTCCAPCLLGTLSRISDFYEPVVFFYNPNIHPYKEYILRRNEVIKVCKLYNLNFIEGDYDVSLWFDRIKTVDGYAFQKEGGSRCEQCFRIRLERTAIASKNLGIKFFTTTLTLGSNKNSDVINKIGSSLADKYDLFFIQADFKKTGAYNFSVKKSKELGIYRQNYCGCVYSSLNKNIESPKL